MTLWTELARASGASGDDILLRQRGNIYEIRYNGMELMSNLNHDSEDILAERAMRLRGRPARNALIGGLGMGFTLRRVLDWLDTEARVTVCELIPEVVDWNRGPIGHLAGHPLSDPRVTVFCGDVAAELAGAAGRYDVILMDTDNGPDHRVRDGNARLYRDTGIALVRRALAPGGIAAFWSATLSPGFEAELTRAGWHWQREDVNLIGGRADAFHHIYVAAEEAATLGLRKAG